MQRRDRIVMAVTAALVALAAALHILGAPPLATFVGAVVALAGIAHLIGEFDRSARQSPGNGGDRDDPVGRRQPAGTLRLYLRAASRPGHGGSGRAGRVDPRQRAPRARARLSCRWMEAWPTPLRRPHPADDRDTADARGRRDGIADACPRAAPAGERARTGAFGGLRAGAARGFRRPHPRPPRSRRARGPGRGQPRPGLVSPTAVGVLVACGVAAGLVSDGSSPRSSRRSRRPASARPSPASSSWRSPATRWRTWSASSSPGAGRPSSRSAWC